ncbi:MAG: hypothetical protein AB9883_07875 [Acidaminococcaceae bacterium]
MKIYKNDKKSAIKIAVDEQKLAITISLKDLKFLFRHSPNNENEYGAPYRIITGKEFEFAEYIAKQLDEQSDYNENDIVIGHVIEECFLKLMEDYQPDILKYPKE